MLSITEGPIWKNAFKFFIPIALGIFFQHLYLIVDTIIIGRFLGDIALAAVGGSTAKIITLLVNLFIGISVGITTYCAQYFGQKDYSRLNKVIINGIFIFALVTLSLTVIGLFYVESILILMNTPPETIPLALSYLNIYLLGMIFGVLYNVFTGVMRALGDSKSSFYVLILCSFLNMILNLIFILVLKLGIIGVVIATIVSQAIGASILAGIMLHKLKKYSRVFSLELDKTLIYNILIVGLPIGIQSIMYSLSNILVQSVINSLGSVVIISWIVYQRIDAIIDIFVSSLSTTVLTFVGQNYGARNWQRVRQSIRDIRLMSIILLGSLTILLILSRNTIIPLFTQNTEVLLIASRLVLIIIPMYFLSIPQMIYTQALRGFGDSLIPTIITIIGVIGFRVFWVLFIVPLNLNVYTLAAGYTLNSLLLSFVFFLYFHYKVKHIKMLPEF
ncbi:MAG: MATE family efflux transporter [Brevinema sp.]